MADLTSIAAVLSSVKIATDLAKIIKNSDVSLANAETKLKIAELISALADMKLELAEVQYTLREKDQNILSLEKQIKEQQEIKFDGKLYWAEGDGTPFCSACYENNNKLIHLTHHHGTRDYNAYYHCKICKQDYEQNA